MEAALARQVFVFFFVLFLKSFFTPLFQNLLSVQASICHEWGGFRSVLSRSFQSVAHVFRSLAHFALAGQLVRREGGVAAVCVKVPRVLFFSLTGALMSCVRIYRIIDPAL